MGGINDDDVDPGLHLRCPLLGVAKQPTAAPTTRRP